MTAKDLLYKYLDYRSRWTLDYMANSKPGVLRRKQIDALLDAFGLTRKHANPEVETSYHSQRFEKELNRTEYLERITDMEYMAEGEFLKDRPSSANEPLLERVLEEVREGSGFAPKKLDKHFPGTDILWGQVLDLRYRLHDLVQHHYTIYEGYIIGLQYSRVLKGQIIEQLEGPIARMDSVLCQILDPEGRDFEEVDLVRGFGFPPEAELREVEYEWSQDDYF